MAMIIIGSYAVAASPPVHRLIRRLAAIPRTPRGAVAFVAFFSMATSLISWAFGPIFAGILAREIVQRVRGIDYRAIGAAAYLGTATIWALGLSSSAALLMATPSSLPPALLKISGAIPLSQTIYTWQSMLTVAIIMTSSVTVAYLTAPANSTKTAESFGVTEGIEFHAMEKRATPGEWLEYSPALALIIGVIGLAYLAQDICRARPIGGAGFEHLQPSVSDGGAVAALEAAVVRAFGECRRSGHRGRAGAVSFLRRDFRHGHHVLDFAAHGWIFCAHLFAWHLSIGGGGVFGGSRDVRSFGREQVGDRGAVRAAGGEGFARSPWMGGAGLQCRRGFAKSDQSILDAAAAGNHEGACARSGRIWIAAASRAIRRWCFL